MRKLLTAIACAGALLACPALAQNPATAPDAKARLEEIGFEVVATNGKQFEEFLAREVARWKSVIETGGITPASN